MKLKNVVTIGGGTGSFVLLSGLKRFPLNISAIVSMADDGGSTGVLRDELGVLPPGDVRQCLVALSESSKELRELMNYRFESGGLKGHSFGNIFLSALEKTNKSFSKGVEEASRILKVKGEVIPIITKSATLIMKLQSGKILNGESEIYKSNSFQRDGVKKLYFLPKVKANPIAIKRILAADLIIIGPGNLYGSILPNLLVEGIPKALQKTKAKIIYNCNLVNKKGQTEKFCLKDYVDHIESYMGRKLDFVTFNSKKPPEKLIEKYKHQEELLVEFGNIEEKRKYEVIRGDFISKQKIKYSKSDKLADHRTFIRHDSDKLAKALTDILKV